MSSEEKKFQDLDLVSDCIIENSYRSMFNEAVSCYYINSNRAAVILAWIATADCLYSRIYELSNDKDQTAIKAIEELKSVKGSTNYEEKLISQSNKCEIIDDYESKALMFVKDTRNNCAHPTDFIPSAETVRHIFNICSQTVLCRNGYRGRNYVQNLLVNSFNDKYFLKNEEKIKSHCNEIIEKVPARMWLQFPKMAADYFDSNPNENWKNKLLIFISELVSKNEDIIKELVKFESKDPEFFYIIVGLTDKTVDYFEEAQRYCAKSELTESLQSGIIDPYKLKSWTNILVIEEFENNEKNLIKKRYPHLIEKLLENDSFIVKNRKQLFELLFELLNERDFNSSIKVIPYLLGSATICEETEQLSNLFKILLENDSNILEIYELFNECTKWNIEAQSILLKNVEYYFEFCSDNYNRTIYLIFEAADNILKTMPQELPKELEDTILKVLKGDLSYDWYEEKKIVYTDFIGQVGLLIDRYGSHLLKLNKDLLPIIEDKYLNRDID